MSRHAKPVFLDSSGRRSRMIKLAGVSLGIALVLAVGLLVVAVSPGVTGSAPGLPHPTQPGPSPASRPEAGLAGNPPGGVPATTASTTPAPATTTSATPTPAGHGHSNSHPPHPSRTR